MRIEPVEIYSDASNFAVMRHPGRRFPGTLIQGDTLHTLCRAADRMCSLIDPATPAFEEANEIRNTLWDRLNHYKAVLTEHGLPLPFSDQFFP
jgi:hypothetical protein